MHRRLFLWSLATLLFGCSTKSIESIPITDESHEMWQSRQQQLTPLDQWHIRGRVAIFIKDKVYNLGLGWEREGEFNAIKLEASLGQGVIRLKKNTEGVELTTAEGDRFIGSNAQQVLHQSTGLIFPVEGLETWIKGIPHHTSYYLPDIDGLGRAMKLEQDGWEINYFDYDTVQLAQLDNTVLPEKIYMKRDSLALKIIIDQWQKQTQESTPNIFPQFPE